MDFREEQKLILKKYFWEVQDRETRKKLSKDKLINIIETLENNYAVMLKSNRKHSIRFEEISIENEELKKQIEKLEKENAEFKKQCSDYDKWVNQARD